MEKIKFKIAGFVFVISFQETEIPSRRKKFVKIIKNYLNDFIFNDSIKKPDYYINIIDILSYHVFKLKNKKNYFINFWKEKDIYAETYYHISLAHFQYILRRAILTLFSKKHGFMLHSSAVLINGKAHIFTGSSGAGKSTVVRLLKKENKPLADDNVFVKKENGIYYLYQTPFIEKENRVKRGKNKFEIGGVYFLKKSDDFKLEKIMDKESVFNKLAKEFWTKDKMESEKQLPFLFKFSYNFDRFFYLYFKKQKKGLLNTLEKNNSQQ